MAFFAGHLSQKTWDENRGHFDLPSALLELLETLEPGVTRDATAERSNGQGPPQWFSTGGSCHLKGPEFLL